MRPLRPFREVTNGVPSACRPVPPANPVDVISKNVFGHLTPLFPAKSSDFPKMGLPRPRTPGALSIGNEREHPTANRATCAVFSLVSRYLSVSPASKYRGSKSNCGKRPHRLPAGYDEPRRAHPRRCSQGRPRRRRPSRREGANRSSSGRCPHRSPRPTLRRRLPPLRSDHRPRSANCDPNVSSSTRDN